MISRSRITALAILFVFQASYVRAAKTTGEKIILFNGVDLSGWSTHSRTWIVFNKEIRGRGAFTEARLSCAKRLSQNFELGMIVRTSDSFQIVWSAQSKSEETVSLRLDTQGGLQLKLETAGGASKVLAHSKVSLEGDLHNYTIISQGGGVSVWAGDKEVLTADRSLKEGGPREFQLVVGADNQRAAFRDIWSRDLGLASSREIRDKKPPNKVPAKGEEPATLTFKEGAEISLFDGEDPADWSVRQPGWKVSKQSMVGTAGSRDAFLVRYLALSKDFKLSFTAEVHGSLRVSWPRNSSENHYRAQHTIALQRDAEGTIRLVRYLGIGKDPEILARSDEAVTDGKHEFEITVLGSVTVVSVDRKPILRTDGGKEVWGLRDLCLRVGGKEGHVSFQSLRYRKVVRQRRTH